MTADRGAILVHGETLLGVPPLRHPAGIVSLVQPTLPVVMLVTGPPMLPLWWAGDVVPVAWDHALRCSTGRMQRFSGDWPSYAYVLEFAREALRVGLANLVVEGEIVDGCFVYVSGVSA